MRDAVIGKGRLGALLAREKARYATSPPASPRAFEKAGAHLLGGVPMTWMRMWAGGFPLYLATAHGARLTDIARHPLRDRHPRGDPEPGRAVERGAARRQSRVSLLPGAAAQRR